MHDVPLFVMWTQKKNKTRLNSWVNWTKKLLLFVLLYNSQMSDGYSK